MASEPTISTPDPSTHGLQRDSECPKCDCFRALFVRRSHVLEAPMRFSNKSTCGIFSGALPVPIRSLDDADPRGSGDQLVQHQLVMCQRLFIAGIGVMLVSATLSATVFAGRGYAMPAVTLIGAVIALTGRIGRYRLLRLARSGDRLVDLGGYPLDMLRDPRFTSRR